MNGYGCDNTPLDWVRSDALASGVAENGAARVSGRTIIVEDRSLVVVVLIQRDRAVSMSYDA